MFNKVKTLYDLYIECDSNVSHVTINDDAAGTTETFDSLSAALGWYGEDREIHPLYSDSEPDESGNMEITLTNAA